MKQQLNECNPDSFMVVLNSIIEINNPNGWNIYKVLELTEKALKLIECDLDENGVNVIGKPFWIPKSCLLFDGFGYYNVINSHKLKHTVLRKLGIVKLNW